MQNLTTLSNGIRVITDHVGDVHSVAFGVWVGTGARHERGDQNGLSHMIEHMLFKGTEKRSAFEITAEIENVGGHMNAYTSRELTSYHVHLLKHDIALAADIISDMVLHSTLPDDELERERDVILQEIGMCADTPDDLVFDEYFETAFKDQALGAPILGTPELIKGYQKSDLQAYIDARYRAGNIVVSASGNVDHDQLCTSLENLFVKTRTGDVQPNTAFQYTGGTHLNEKELEQSHVVLGFESVSRLSDRHYVMQALSNLLGGGMSSRLFQEVREKRGLVYSIYTFQQAFVDRGLFGIYAGTGPDRLGELMPVLCDELKKIAGTPPSDEELSRTKAQLKSSVVIGQESMMNRADRQAKHILFRGEPMDLKSVIAQIDAITPEQIQELAAELFTKTPTLAALGPLENLPDFSDIEKNLAV